MLPFNNISISALLQLLLIAVVIFLTHRLINTLVNKWIKKEQKQSLNSVYMPVTINLVWIIFIIYAIYTVALLNPIIAMFISGLLLIAAWNYVKDFVQGILFRFQKGDLVTQQIKIGDLSGEVIKMKNTGLHIQLENGESVHYPYSKLTNKILAINTSVNKDYQYCTLNLSVPYTKDIEKIKKQLDFHLLSVPWIISTMQIKTEVISKDSEKINFKINAYTLDKKYVSKIQQSIDNISFD